MFFVTSCVTVLVTVVTSFTGESTTGEAGCSVTVEVVSTRESFTGRGCTAGDARCGELLLSDLRPGLGALLLNEDSGVDKPDLGLTPGGTATKSDSCLSEGGDFMKLL